MSSFPWLSLSPWGLLAFVGFGYARGYIVNRRTYSDIVKVMEARIADKQAEADAWRQTAMTALAANRELAGHSRLGVEAAQTAAAALVAVSTPAGGEAGADAVA